MSRKNKFQDAHDVDIQSTALFFSTDVLVSINIISDSNFAFETTLFLLETLNSVLMTYTLM